MPEETGAKKIAVFVAIPVVVVAALVGIFLCLRNRRRAKIAREASETTSSSDSLKEVGVYEPGTHDLGAEKPTEIDGCPSPMAELSNEGGYKPELAGLPTTYQHGHVPLPVSGSSYRPGAQEVSGTTYMPNASHLYSPGAQEVGGTTYMPNAAHMYSPGAHEVGGNTYMPNAPHMYSPGAQELGGQNMGATGTYELPGQEYRREMGASAPHQ